MFIGRAKDTSKSDWFVDPYDDEEDEFWPESLFGSVCVQNSRISTIGVAVLTAPSVSPNHGRACAGMQSTPRL